MNIRVLTTGLALMCSLCFLTHTVSAAVYTSNADVEAMSPQTVGDPPLLDIKRFNGAGGTSYTNQVSGAAFTPFGEVRTASATFLGTAVDGFQFPIELPDGHSLIALTVLRGTIVAGPGLATAKFDLGRTFLLDVDPLSGFNPENPSTWTGHVVVAEYAMVQDDVFAGPDGSPIPPYPSPIVNLSSVNTATSALTQGQFLFKEASTPAENALVIGGSPNFGDDFIRNVVGSNPPTFFEGIFAEIDQTLLTAPNTLDDADRLAINSYFTSLGVGDWATSVGGGGAGFDYDPVFSPTATGDFRATVGIDAHIVFQAVPEPGSMLVFAGMGLVGACVAYRRRKALN